MAIDDSLHVDTIVKEKQKKLLYLVSEFEKIIKIWRPCVANGFAVQIG